MKSLKLFTISFLVACFSVTTIATEEVVVQDGDVTLSKDELSYYVSRWTRQMRDSAIQDEGDRLELLNLVLANKKVAIEADKYAAEHPDFYWEYKSQVEAYQRSLMLRHYSARIEVPDFSELAREQYTVKRDKYASIPERRISSHILFPAKPGVPREGVLVEAQKVLDQLRDGTNFEEMVRLHSGEPGAAERAGKFDKWLEYGEVGVSPPYTEGLFAIEEVGQYSELVQTQFGVHIIRLDGIQEKGYKSFEEVKASIVKELEEEYRKLAMKDLVGQFQMSEDVVIDTDAVDAILAPYTNPE